MLRRSGIGGVAETQSIDPASARAGRRGIFAALVSPTPILGAPTAFVSPVWTRAWAAGESTCVVPERPIAGSGIIGPASMIMSSATDKVEERERERDA